MNTPNSPDLPSQGLWADIRRALPSMIVYEAGFRLMITALGAPLAAWILETLVNRSGNPAVSNTSIGRFLITPSGFACGLFMILGYVMGQLFLSAGLIGVAALARAGRRVNVLDGVRTAFWSSLKLFRVGLFQLLGNAWLLAPFLGLAGLTFALLLTRHDINYYLAEKPPSFYAAAGIGVILAAMLLYLLAIFYIRTVFVLPMVLLESQSVHEAFKASEAMVTPHIRRVGTIMLGWHAIVTLLAVLAGKFYPIACSTLLDYAGTRLIVLVPVASVLLLLHGAIAAMFSFAQVAGASFLAVELYDRLSDGRARAWADRVEHDPSASFRIPRWGWRLGMLGTLILLIGTGVSLVRDLRKTREVLITAHRGSSREAPENTVAAIKKAIEHHADYAEIDIHLTSDGVPIVFHDEDLSRMAGIAKRPNEFTLVELQKIDIGTSFSPKFAGEKIPTLKEVIDTARGKIKINIELKPVRGSRELLAEKVADLIREEDFEKQCFVTSLDAKSVALAYARNPKLERGAIISAAVGDMTKLNVEVLSVRTGLITSSLLGRARAAGKQIVAWTVDDSDLMGELIDQGVDGIITNDPATAIAVRAERRALPTWQRVVLGFRSRLAGR